MTRAEELAWAGGLFEGEGCITHQPDRPHSIRLQLASTDRDVVERFATIMGGGSISLMSRTERLTANPKPIWAWVTVSSSAAIALELLLPYFGDRRSERARLALKRRSDYIAYATRQRLCPTCHTTFRPRWSGAAANTKYCSTPCRNKAQYQRTRSGRRAEPSHR